MTDTFGKKEWIELFRHCGMTEDMMDNWHRRFETNYPQAHQNFLQWLNLPEQEIATIRQKYTC